MMTGQPQPGRYRTAIATALLLLIASFTFLSNADADIPAVAVVQQTAEVSPLLAGQPLEREISGGQSQAYQVSMSAGQFAQLLVVQKGADVEMLLFGPDGKQMTQTNSSPGAQGNEQIRVVADVSGDYRLVVRAVRKDAPSGKYEVKLNELREATDTDRKRVGADRLLAEVARLFAQRNETSLRKAIETGEAALPILREIKDRSREAGTLVNIGTFYSQLGELPKSVPYYEQAIPIWRELKNRNSEAQTLNNLANAQLALGNRQQALDAYQQSLLIRRELKDPASVANALNNLGNAYRSLGDFQIALDYLTEALSTSRGAKDRRIEAFALNNLGFCYYRLGEKEKARDYYSQAIPIFQEVNERRQYAGALATLGRINYELGNKDQYESVLRQVLPVLRELGDRRTEALMLKNLGRVKMDAGERQNALDFYNQSLERYNDTGDLQGESETYQMLGQLNLNFRDWDPATDSFTKALERRRAVSDLRGEAESLYGLAQSESGRGNLPAAQKHMEAALTIVDDLRSRVASQDLRTTYSASVQDYYEFYIELLMRLNQQKPSAGFAGQALEASERARARTLRELLAESRADIRQGVDPQLLFKERELRQQISSRTERTMQMLSAPHSKAQETAAKKELDELSAAYEAVQVKIRQNSPRYAALTQPQPLHLADLQQQVLNPSTLLLEYSLGKDRSWLWLMSHNGLRSYELPGREKIEMMTRRTLELLTARNRNVLNESATRRAVRVAQADAEYQKAAAELSRILLGKVILQTGRKRLLIAGDGVLQYLPFGALPIPGRRITVPNTSPQKYRSVPLVAEHEIVSLPSASLLAELRRNPNNNGSPTKSIAVLADPVFEATDERFKAATGKTQPGATSKTVVNVDETRMLKQELGELRLQRLPYTRQEADSILQLASDTGMKALDFQASRAVAMSEDLSQYSVIHFATHGYFDTEHPELSRLVFSRYDEGGKPQSGSLLALDLYNLKLRADLAVLSGCKTAIGKEIKGEGIGVLTRGLMYAGVPRVVASLWSISDQGTAQLMRRFYRSMNGTKVTNPAAALRQAQLQLAKNPRWQSPYYWAAFVLQGEW